MSTNMNDFQRLQHKTNKLERMTNGLEKTLQGLGNLQQLGLNGTAGNSNQNGEPKYLTREQVMNVREKLVGFKKEIQANEQLKHIFATKFRQELLSIKEDVKQQMILHAVASGTEFRDAVRQMLLQIRSEVEKSKQENEILRKQQPAAKNSCVQYILQLQSNNNAVV